MTLEGIETLLATLINTVSGMPLAGGKTPVQAAREWWLHHPQLKKDLEVLYPSLRQYLPTTLGGTLEV